MVTKPRSTLDIIKERVAYIDEQTPGYEHQFLEATSTVIISKNGVQVALVMADNLIERYAIENGPGFKFPDQKS